MFTAVYSPIRKGDIPAEILKFILENQTPSQWRGGGGADLMAVFPFDAPRSNQKVNRELGLRLMGLRLTDPAQFKIGCMSRFLEWGATDLLMCLKKAIVVSTAEVGEALASVQVIRKRRVWLVSHSAF